MNRVVITGMAGLSPIGCDWSSVRENILAGRNGVHYEKKWDGCDGLRTRLSGVVDDFRIPEYYPRKKIRTMGRVALMATRASELALEDAGLLDDENIKHGDMGIAYGSSSGSPDALTKYAVLPLQHSMKGIASTTYIQMMSNTCPANLAVFFELKGRVISTISGCTSGSQGIGFAYEAIKHGYQKMMLAGGAEEASLTIAAVFDVMGATSTANDTPEKTPRPFDSKRDGLVVSEGAGTFVLEELSHALARGAKIRAEVVGYGTNADGAHITQPNQETVHRVMEMALEDAGLPASEIGYISAHATGTSLGDVIECRATNAVFGEKTPLSSFKSYVGHPLGAAGVLEAWVAIHCMNEGWFLPTANLDDVDPECSQVEHIQGEARQLDVEYVMSNNFAFGGINTSLVLKRWS